MGDDKMVSAEEARGLLDAIQPTDLPWKTYRDGRDYVVDAQDCAVCEGDMLRSEARLIAAAPDLARTVIELHARAEQAERERDEARSAPRPCPWCDGRIGVDGVSFHAPSCKVIEADALKAERDRLRSKLINAGESWTRCMGERDRAEAERDRLRAVLADLRSVVAAYHPLACVSACRAARSRIDSALAGSATVIAEQAADAAREGSMTTREVQDG